MVVIRFQQSIVANSSLQNPHHRTMNVEMGAFHLLWWY